MTNNFAMIDRMLYRMLAQDPPPVPLTSGGRQFVSLSSVPVPSMPVAPMMVRFGRQGQLLAKHFAQLGHLTMRVF